MEGYVVGPEKNLTPEGISERLELDIPTPNFLDCGNKPKKNLPHPEAQVRGRCGEKQIDRITNWPIKKGSQVRMRTGRGNRHLIRMRARL